jgi:8-oxo-dGTP diphosphatase
MLDVLKEFLNLPRFPDGRINYSTSKRAPVITCFVMYNGKLLLLKRSDKVSTYKGKWSVVAGYIDEDVDLKEKALSEVNEELGIRKEDAEPIKMGEFHEVIDDTIKKTWLIYPFLLKLKKAPKIVIDFEHTEFKWINPEDIGKYDVDIGLDVTLKKVLE